jgi:hypothetical protein
MTHRRSATTVTTLELQWFTDEHGTVLYAIYRLDQDGQLHLVATFDQGPFDTALEVAQWAVKAISSEVPPSSC